MSREQAIPSCVVTGARALAVSKAIGSAGSWPRFGLILLGMGLDEAAARGLQS
jgi:hypothetical protein